MRVVKELTELIGQTPILELCRLYPNAPARVYAKLEMFNPMSNKDRPVLYMIRSAQAKGLITPKIEVVEASSGNTAIAAASLGAIMNFPVCIFMSESVSIERQLALAAFGAKVFLTPAAEYTRGARERAITYCEQNPSTTFYLGQHQNPDNPMAHELSTGPELWEQLDGKIDAVVVALGTCGTFDGVTRFLKRKNPAIKVFGVEPAGSPLYSGGQQGSHKIYGMGPGLITEIFERAEIKPDEIITVTDEDAYEWTRRVAHREGLLVGLTSGAMAWSAGQVAGRSDFAGKAIVTFFYDTGERYLSIPDLFPAGDIEHAPTSSEWAFNKT